MSNPHSTTPRRLDDNVVILDRLGRPIALPPQPTPRDAVLAGAFAGYTIGVTLAALIVLFARLVG